MPPRFKFSFSNLVSHISTCMCSNCSSAWNIRECRFYKELAEQVNIKTAKCYGSFPKDDGSCCLLLEDCMAMDGGEVIAYPFWCAMQTHIIALLYPL